MFIITFYFVSLHNKNRKGYSIGISEMKLYETVDDLIKK